MVSGCGEMRPHLAGAIGGAGPRICHCEEAAGRRGNLGKALPFRTSHRQNGNRPAVLNADGFDAGELANVRDSFAKGSSNDYDITPKELDSRRIPESGCRVLEDYFRQQYDWTMTVDEARLVKFRVSFTGELDGQLNVRAVCYQTGGHWYLDLSAVNLNLFS